MKDSKANFIAKALAEVFVYFLATLGISDMILNTAIIKKMRWVEDEILPSTLLMCYLAPGLIIAGAYLVGNRNADYITLLVYIVSIMAGSYYGSGKVIKMDGASVRKFMGWAMIASIGALIVRLIVSAGTSGTAAGLHGWQFLIAVPFFFAMGCLNTFGLPAKPPVLSFLLILGLSPIAALTVIAMGFVGPWTASIRYFKSGRYDKTMVKFAAVFGSIGALIGSFFALSINTYLLTAILIAVMAFVAYTMLKEK